MSKIIHKGVQMKVGQKITVESIYKLTISNLDKRFYNRVQSGQLKSEKITIDCT